MLRSKTEADRTFIPIQCCKFKSSINEQIGGVYQSRAQQDDPLSKITYSGSQLKRFNNLKARLRHYLSCERDRKGEACIKNRRQLLSYMNFVEYGFCSVAI